MKNQEPTFEPGKNYSFKVRRTEYSFVYDEEIEMYAFKKRSPQKEDVSYILEKDLLTAYRLVTRGLKSLPEVTVI